jgi:hypothetical protein
MPDGHVVNRGAKRRFVGGLGGHRQAKLRCPFLGKGSADQTRCILDEERHHVWGRELGGDK